MDTPRLEKLKEIRNEFRYSEAKDIQSAKKLNSILKKKFSCGSE